MFPISEPEGFEYPDEVVIDAATGLALNIPAVYQGDPRWWENEALYGHIKRARKAAGIEIEDFPNGKPGPRVTGRRVTQREMIARLRAEEEGKS